MRQIQSLDLWTNTETRSRNHCFRGKAISITYSECVFVALVIQHVKHVRDVFSGLSGCRAEMERDGTSAETRFGFPAKRTSPFISAGVSVQSAAGSRGVRISGSNAG